MPPRHLWLVLCVATIACADHATRPSSSPEAFILVDPPGQAIVNVTRVGLRGVLRGECAAPAYRWHFGDGEEASGAEVSHAFRRTGTFEVTLVIEGCGIVASGRVRYTVRTLNGGWSALATSSPFTPPGYVVSLPVELTQIEDRLEGHLLSLAWCPDRDPVTGYTRLARISGQVRHPRTVSFEWRCSRFEGTVDPWLDSMTSSDGRRTFRR